MTEFTRRAMLEPWRRSGQPIPIVTGSIRPVYRVTRILGCSQGSSDSTISGASNLNPVWIPTRLLQCSYSSHHWATQVGESPSVGMELASDIDNKEAPQKRPNPTIFELTAKDGIIDQDKAMGQYAEYTVSGPVLMGHTLLCDSEIEKIGVLKKNGADYHVRDNNCQKFCQQLEQCILIPQNMQSILKAGQTFPSRAKEIMHRQFWEYILTEDYIPSNNTCIWGQNDMYFLIVLTVLLYGWRGNTSMFRHLQRALPDRGFKPTDLHQMAYPWKRPAQIGDSPQRTTQDPQDRGTTQEEAAAVKRK
ncbi:hypothetical protein F53441_9691 [Fusarium austroafricanum]|uniref:Uncharacterized protein n=1 Tax=Fusarium austroafricanum TaxID=2364996 RepID=A0A8H4KAD5_9HYPO|nr:hypothetical protein F53441_9691 [Fusarium austroafricanum]